MATRLEGFIDLRGRVIEAAKSVKALEGKLRLTRKVARRNQILADLEARNGALSALKLALNVEVHALTEERTFTVTSLKDISAIRVLIEVHGWKNGSIMVDDGVGQPLKGILVNMVDRMKL